MQQTQVAVESQSWDMKTNTLAPQISMGLVSVVKIPTWKTGQGNCRNTAHPAAESGYCAKSSADSGVSHSFSQTWVAGGARTFSLGRDPGATLSKKGNWHSCATMTLQVYQRHHTSTHKSNRTLHSPTPKALSNTCTEWVDIAGTKPKRKTES